MISGAVPEEVVKAAERGDEAVLAWLDGGGQVNATFEFVFSDGPASGMTLLMLAMTCGHEGLMSRCRPERATPR